MSADPFADLERTVAALRAQARPAGPDGPYIVALDIEADGIERAIATLRPAYAMLHGEREAARDLGVAMEAALRKAGPELAAAREERDSAQMLARAAAEIALRPTTVNRGDPAGVVLTDGLSTEQIGEACRSLSLELLRVAQGTGVPMTMLEIRALRGAAPRPPLTAEEVHRRVEASRDEAKQIVDEHLDAIRSCR